MFIDSEASLESDGVDAKKKNLPTLSEIHRKGNPRVRSSPNRVVTQNMSDC